MIWFVMVPPSVFFVIMFISLLAELWVIVLDAMDNDEINWERVQAYKDKIEAQDAGLPLETYIFLRKAAELRQP